MARRALFVHLELDRHFAAEGRRAKRNLNDGFDVVAALRATSLREALWSALTYGVAIAIGAAAIRAMGIPRLVGPALLMLLFYLWDVLHGTPPTRRRDPRWLWQTALLAALGIVVAWWNVRLIG